MSKSILSTDAVKALSSWAGKKVAATKGLKAVVDALVADGVVADDLVSGGKGKKVDSPIINAVKDAIVAGFSVPDQQLLLKDTKTLSEVKKAQKRYLIQQIGSCVKDVRNALTNRATGASGQRTLKQLINAEVTKRIVQVKEDAAPNYDAVELLKALAIVAKLTKA